MTVIPINQSVQSQTSTDAQPATLTVVEVGSPAATQPVDPSVPQPDPRAAEAVHHHKIVMMKLGMAKTFIHDDYIKLTPNTAVLIAAPSGKGKTTAIYSAAVHEIIKGGLVGIFTNEMGKETIDSKILRALSGILNISIEEASTRFARNWEIFSHAKYPELIFFDRAYNFIFNMTVQRRFTLVLFDQMSNMKKDSKSGVDIDPWKAMPKFTERLVHWQESCGRFMPPIVLVQQANPFAKNQTPSLQAALRGSRGTITDIAVGILIVRTESGTTFILDKYRDDNVITNGRVTCDMVFANGVYKPSIVDLLESLEVKPDVQN